MPTEQEQKRIDSLLKSGVEPRMVADAIKQSRASQAELNKPEDNIFFGEGSLTSSLGGAVKTAVTQPFMNVKRDIDYYRSIPKDERYAADLIGTIGKAPLSLVAGVGQGLGEGIGGILETADDLTGEVVSDFLRPGVEYLAGTETGQKAIANLERLDEDSMGVSGDILEMLNLVGVTAIAKGGTAQSLKNGFKEAMEQTAKGTIRTTNAAVNTAKGTTGLQAVFGAKDPVKLATEILQPSKKSIMSEVAQGKVPAQVQALIDNVKVSADFGELKLNLSKAIKVSQNQIDDIIKGDNFLVGPTVLNKLDEAMAVATNNPAVKESVIKSYQAVKDRYAQFFDDAGEITREAANTMKKELNKVTGPLQKKKSAGTLTGRESAELQALDLVRDGLKTAVEGGDELVKNLNAKYAGLKDAIESLTAREIAASKAVGQTVLQKIASPVIELLSAGTGAGSAAFVSRQALKMEDNLEKLTKQLQKLSNDSKTSTSKTQVSTDPKAKVQTPEAEVSKLNQTDSSLKVTIDRINNGVLKVDADKRQLVKELSEKIDNSTSISKLDEEVRDIARKYNTTAFDRVNTQRYSFEGAKDVYRRALIDGIAGKHIKEEMANFWIEMQRNAAQNAKFAPQKAKEIMPKIEKMANDETLGQLLKAVTKETYKTAADFKKNGPKKLKDALKARGIKEDDFWTVYLIDQNTDGNE